MSLTNRQLVVKSYPVEAVGPEHFELRETPVPLRGDLDVLVRNLWIGFDAGLRVSLNPGAPGMAHLARAIGDVMRSTAVGQVVESDVDDLPPGTYVVGGFGWQEWAVCAAAEVKPVPVGLDPKAMLGIYGTTGLPAYFGMTEVGRPSAGDIVVVSGAAGATGSVAAQIARLAGCTTIGIAGGQEKCHWLTERARLDVAIDYKHDDVDERLRQLAPNGIDVFFDNVGGGVLDSVLANLARGARIVLCGGISRGYNQLAPPAGPVNYFNLIARSARMQGFMMSDYLARFDEARQQLRSWVESGELVYAEDVQHGLENAPDTLQRLFDGRNLGKQLLKVGDPPIT